MREDIRSASNPRRSSHADAASQPPKLKPYQILVQLSISDLCTWDAQSPVIRSQFDTGLDHKFPNRDRYITRWSALHPQELSPLRSIREGGRAI